MPEEKDDLDVHFIFLSSKPLDLDLQDKDEVVPFLSFGIFDQYVKGKLENTEEGRFMRLLIEYKNYIKEQS